MRHTAALVLTLLAAGVHAAPVYRCGSSYQDTPCAANQPGQLLEVADPRSAAQVRAAQAHIKAEARRTEAQVAERRAQERAAALAAQRTHKTTAKAAAPKPAASRPAPAEKPVLYRAPANPL